MNINMTLFGQMAAFAVFVWFCMKFVWPALTHALEERKNKIADGLDARLTGLGTAVVVDGGILDEVFGDDAAIVVRPDRYVAAVVADPAGVASALDEVLPACVG